MISSRHEAWIDRAWLLAVICVSSLWCVSAARALGPTFDEPFYLEAGLEAWRTGSYAALLTRGTMPLPAEVATLPAYAYERWSGTPLDLTSDLHTMLRWGRTASLLFWVLLLVYVHAAARRLAGPWGGRLAVALVSVEPVLLGHAALATADVAITACLIALAFHFARGRDQDVWRRVCIPGAWYGAALLAKATTVVFGPLCLIGVALASGSFTFQRFIRDFGAIAAIGVGITFLYCGSDWRTEPSFVEWAATLPRGGTGDAVRWFADHLRIFPNGAVGLVNQILHGLRGHGSGAYLLGDVRESFWYYFPAALSMKAGLALVTVFLFAASARTRALLNWPNAVAALLLLASVTSRVQIGVRFYLPLLVFAGIGASVSLVQAWQSRGRGVRALLASAAAAGVIWNAGAAVKVWPHGVCYVNPLWGGPERGIFLLSDSNCDWGQGVPDLVAWHRDHGAPPLDVWYFGTDPALSSLPFRPVRLHALALTSDADVLAAVRGRHLAVSATLLRGTIISDSHRRAAEFLQRQTPVGRTMTFVVFDFTGPAHASQ